jgi:hypothetical protein
VLCDYGHVCNSCHCKKTQYDYVVSHIQLASIASYNTRFHSNISSVLLIKETLFAIFMILIGLITIVQFARAPAMQATVVICITLPDCPIQLADVSDFLILERNRHRMSLLDQSIARQLQYIRRVGLEMIDVLLYISALQHDHNCDLVVKDSPGKKSKTTHNNHVRFVSLRRIPGNSKPGDEQVSVSPFWRGSAVKYGSTWRIWRLTLCLEKHSSYKCCSTSFVTVYSKTSGWMWCDTSDVTRSLLRPQSPLAWILIRAFMRPNFPSQRCS